MKYGMVIDLDRCSSCGACAIACKAENNTRNRAFGQSFNWADFVQRTEGRFPNTIQVTIPVLCNHCESPACVKVCPTGSMYITGDGVVMHDDEKCIGCRMCQKACPYSKEELSDKSMLGEEYSVISFNPPSENPLGDAALRPAMIKGCTGSGKELADKVGVIPAYRNDFKPGDVAVTRKAGIVEKCTFCYHRITHSLMPACVEACPAQCRIFGDLDDPKSAVSVILREKKSFQLQPEAGTRPKVFYVGKNSPRQ